MAEGRARVNPQYISPDGVVTPSERRLYQHHSPQTPLKKWELIAFGFH